MNDEKDTERIVLRWGVTLATILPVLFNIVLLDLCKRGKCGRCDAILMICWSFRISIGIFAAALIGTGWMMFSRKREPLWILIAATVIQAVCMTFMIQTFVVNN